MSFYSSFWMLATYTVLYVSSMVESKAVKRQVEPDDYDEYEFEYEDVITETESQNTTTATAGSKTSTNTKYAVTTIAAPILNKTTTEKTSK